MIDDLEFTKRILGQQMDDLLRKTTVWTGEDFKRLSILAEVLDNLEEVGTIEEAAGW